MITPAEFIVKTDYFILCNKDAIVFILIVNFKKRREALPSLLVIKTAGQCLIVEETVFDVIDVELILST